MKGAPRVAVDASPGCTATSIVWERGGERRVTAIAKIALRLVSNRVATQAEPALFHRTAREDPPRYLRSAGELAPLLPRAELLVVGHASAESSGAAARRARVGYWRGDRILIDKSVPLLPALPGTTALVRGLGPTPARAPERMRWLGGHSPPDLSQGFVRLPEGLEPAFFQSAPVDQQLAEILPGDGLLLDGLMRGLPRLVTTLPTLRGSATLQLAGGRDVETVELALRPDTLSVDLDTGLCHVLLRGHFGLTGTLEGARLKVAVRVAAPPMSAEESPTEPQAAETGTVALRAIPDLRPKPGAAAAKQQTAALGAVGIEDEPSVDLCETVSVDESAVLEETSRFATPFDRVPPEVPVRVKPAQAAGEQGTPPRPPAWLHPSAGATVPGTSLTMTARVDAAEVERLRAQFATPFEGKGAAARPGPSSVPPPPSSPPPARPRAAEPDPSLFATAHVDAAELERLRAQFATPFERKPAPTQDDLSGTASVDPAELEQLRAEYAVPFDKPGAAAARGQGVPPRASPARRGWTGPSPQPGATLVPDEDDGPALVQVTPFEQKPPAAKPAATPAPRPAPYSPVVRPPVPKLVPMAAPAAVAEPVAPEALTAAVESMPIQSTGYGAAFLDALAELEA